VFHFSTYCPSSFRHYFVPSDTEAQSVVWQWLGQQPALFFASGIQKLNVDGTNVWTNLDNMLRL